MLAKPQKQKLCKSATPPRILVAAGCERRLMSIKGSYLYFSPLATQWTLGPGLVVARWESPPIRRAYLSATLVATDAFVRAFGRKPDVVISPTTTAGECERLILISSIAFPESDGTPQLKKSSIVISC